MKKPGDSRIYISRNGITQAIGPEDGDLRAYHESLIQADYDRCHPEDSFEFLKRRARFSKEDKGLLLDWMTVAAIRARECEKRAAEEEEQKAVAA